MKYNYESFRDENKMTNLSLLVKDYMDNVHINCENEDLRNNRLALCTIVKNIYEYVYGDLAKLQKVKIK